MTRDGLRVAGPSIGTRIWSWLGFRQGAISTREAPPGLEHWIRIQIDTDVSIADRLRILVAGRARILFVMHCEKDFGEYRTSSTHVIPPPGADR